MAVVEAVVGMGVDMAVGTGMGIKAGVIAMVGLVRF